MYYQKIYLPFDGIYPEKESGMFVFPENDAQHERDKVRIQNMYPEAAKRLAPYVEEACDRMEHEGGILYDEYPDQLMLRRACREICRQVQKEEDAEDVLTLVSLGRDNRLLDKQRKRLFTQSTFLKLFI